MKITKKLVTLGLLGILGISSSAKIFNPVDLGENTKELTGRLDFYNKNTGYSKWAQEGDEIGFFSGNLCLGSTNQVHSLWSHYIDLKINSDSWQDILDGKIDYFVKVYNSQTNSLWEPEIRGYSARGFDIQATSDLGYVPEPSTFGILGLGAIFLRKRRK